MGLSTNDALLILVQDIQSSLDKLLGAASLHHYSAVKESRDLGCLSQIPGTASQHDEVLGALAGKALLRTKNFRGVV